MAGDNERSGAATGASFKQAVEQELHRRARNGADAARLVVDYYRIRRRMAYPLPVTHLHVPAFLGPDSTGYPWSIWMMWTLQERIVSLGTQVQRRSDGPWRDLARRDLLALAQWPRYDQYDKPDLCLSHAMQTLHHAVRQWDWLDDELCQAIRGAGQRVVEQHRAWSDEHHRRFDVRIAERDLADIPRQLHNILIIGGIGLSLASQLADHPDAGVLTRRATNAVLGVLDAKGNGHSEGVAYNGYVLDFAADLLATLEGEQRQTLLTHPQLARMLEQSVVMGAPGRLLQLAELGDVEPREMPFHASAHAKLLRLRPAPRSAWYLARCDPAWLRSDALAALLHADPQTQPQAAPDAGAIAGHDAVVLRSGWDGDDLAVAVSASAAATGHVHLDAGSVVIGTAGDWLITDPGYQQYLKKQERTFTLGSTAHNAPLIDGCAQTRMGAAERVALEQIGDDLWHAAVDITGCYEVESLRQAVRYVWLIGRQTVVIADRVDTATPALLTYHWHGHADVGWWVEDEHTAVVHVEPTTLRLHSVQATVAEAQIERLPGSRGQLTLTTTHETAEQNCCWWVFSLAALGQVRLSADASQLDLAGQSLRVGP